MIEAVLPHILSMLGVGVLVGVAYLMGFRQNVRLRDHAHMLEVAAAAGDEVVHALMDGDGKAGLIVLRGGDLILIKAIGDKLGVRRLPLDGVAKIHLYRPRAHRALGIKVTTRDIGYPDVRIEVNDKEAPAWLDRIRREIG
jgi:hypothetical protein